jgi:hypothetical protein
MKHIIFLILLFSSSLFANDLSKYPYTANLNNLTGAIVPPAYKPSLNAYQSDGSVAIPETFDWRLSGLTPVENQGNCGSCYAFATASVFEDVIKITTGRTVDFSEQYLVDCSLKNGDSNGCNGGWQLHDYHKYPGKEYQGAIDGSQYPYTARDGACRSGLTPLYSIVSWSEVANDTNSIKEAIMKYGPVWSTVYADNSFWQYTGGYFCGQESQVNHAVTLVGWTKRGWILKNSWSENWGIAGYMEIGFGCSSVGFGTSYVVFQESPNPDPPDPPNPDPEYKFCKGEKEAYSRPGGRQVNMTVKNNSGIVIELFWLDYKGQRIDYGQIDNGKKKTIRTYLNHAWVAVNKSEDLCLELKELKTSQDKNWKIE